jgi:excisionase family DNA binding protein
LTAAEVATQLNVPVSTVRQWLWDGVLRGQRVGGSNAGWRVRARDLAQFVAQHPIARVGGPGEQPRPNGVRGGL